MTTTATLDVPGLSEAIEARDAAGQLAVYAPDAELVLVDALNPPSRPRVLRGAAAIGAYLEDVCSRDMTHHVEATVSDGSRIAFQVGCRYGDGTRVQCICVAEVRGGLIVRQRTVQAWDS
jgi:ketosteroid isomerase-like protein